MNLNSCEESYLVYLYGRILGKDFINLNSCEEFI